MKNVKLILATALSILMLLSSVAMASPIDKDGSSGGTLINTIDGKEIREYPVSPELKKLQEKKAKISELHFKFKKEEITKDKYLSALKLLDASPEVLKMAEVAVAFSTPSKNSALLTKIPPSATSSTAYKRIGNLFQQAQINGYYCGPATASSIIGARTSTYSQSTLATSLRTNTTGTAWYDGAGGTGYPMADTLNSYCETSWYIPYGTVVDAATIQSHIVLDIDSNYGTAGDAYEVVGGPHLVGHPNSNIFHWFAIDGYENYANDIWYADSVYGASSVSWNASVPQYSKMSYTTIAQIVNGRGIIW